MNKVKSLPIQWKKVSAYYPSATGFISEYLANSNSKKVKKSNFKKMNIITNHQENPR